jgi:hydroxymethylpyrimidine pyrophosphatase-like HAD family hydrolase
VFGKDQGRNHPIEVEGVVHLKIKLIALDMDGTVLLNDHKSITPRAKQAIGRAVTKKILVVPSSGRIVTVLPAAVTSLPGIDFAITSNGSLVYKLKDKEIIYSNSIPIENVLLVLHSLPPSLWVEIWYHGKIYLEQTKFSHFSDYPLNPFHAEVVKRIGVGVENLISCVERMPDGAEKINVPMMPPSVKRKVWEPLSRRSEYSLIDTQSGIEIMNAGASKANGILALCRYLCRNGTEIRMRNVMAIGDSENDVEALQACGLGIAMGNSCDRVKKNRSKYHFS